MATETQEKTGTVASPEPTKPEWVSLEQAEKLTKQIGKRFVKKDDAKDAKKFFYKIIGMHKNIPAGFNHSTDEFLISYEVQKYHRNKMVKSKKRDEGGNQFDAEENLQVDGHEMKEGIWVCVDQTASFFKDSKDFSKEFESDKED